MSAIDFINGGPLREVTEEPEPDYPVDWRAVWVLRMTQRTYRVMTRAKMKSGPTRYQDWTIMEGPKRQADAVADQLMRDLPWDGLTLGTFNRICQDAKRRL